jgi:hypothetical protein
MAHWDTRSLPLCLLGVQEALQEASQWDLRSLSLYFPLVVLLVYLILVIVLAVQLLRRTGHHPAWCILAIFPV